jgi:hypothetical protein
MKIFAKALKYFVVVTIALLVPMQVFAYSSDQRFEGERSNFYNPYDIACGNTNITTSVSSTLPADFPDPARTVFTNASNAAQTSPNVLAAVYMNEHGIDNYKTIPTNIDSLNTAVTNPKSGAKGPFQWLPSNWKPEFGDITNFKDSAEATAKVFLSQTAKIGTSPDLGTVTDKKEGTVAYAMGVFVGWTNYDPNDGYTKGYIESGLKRFQSIGTSTSSGSGGSTALPGTTSRPTNQPTAFKPKAQADTASGKPEPGKVFILGDSILAANAGNKTKEDLSAGGWSDVELNAVSGRGLKGGLVQPDGLGVLQDSATKDTISKSKVVVMELGTNAYDRSTFGKDVEDAIKLIKDANPTVTIYWIDLAAKSPEGGSRNVDYQGQNKAIYNQSKLGYTPVSWFKTVYPKGDPTNISKDLDDSNNLIENGDVYVHPTDTGVDAYAKMLSDAVINGGGTSINLTKSTSCPSGDSNGTGNCVDDGRIMKINDAVKLGDAIDQYIKSQGGTGTPLDGKGGKLVEGAIRQGVNPFLEVTIAQKEQGFGRIAVVGPAYNVPGTSNGSSVDAHNTFGLTATESQPHVDVGNVSGLRHWYAWDSYESSLDGGGTSFDQPTYLKTNYLDKGLTKVGDIMLKYAPPGDHNDTTGYVQGILDGNKKMVALAGSSISCDGGGSLKDIQYKDKAVLITRLDKAIADGKIIVKATGTHPGQTNEMITNDIHNTAQEPLLRALVILAEQFGKPITLELIKENQTPCGDFAKGATNYGPYTSSHAYGLAADFTAAGSDPATVDLFKAIYSNKSLLNVGELEHNPVPDGAKNIKFGEDYEYPAAIQEGHKDHIHMGIHGSGQQDTSCQPKPGGENV